MAFSKVRVSGTFVPGIRGMDDFFPYCKDESHACCAIRVQKLIRLKFFEQTQIRVRTASSTGCGARQSG
jgi:hypothetical protein